MSQNLLRTLSVLLGLLWSTALAAAVTSPVGDEAWQTTTTHAVTWTASELADSVTLELLKNGRLQTVLAESAPNTGSFAWTIPNGLQDASDYKIRLRSGATSAESPADFSIGAKVVDLTVAASPAAGGTTTPEGTVQRVAGLPYPVVAEPDLEYSFSGWGVDSGAEVVDSAAVETTVTLSSSSTLTANFIPLPILFQADFESGVMPPSVLWSVIDGYSSPGDEPAHWKASKKYTTTSTYCAVCPWGESNLDEWLILPPLDLSLLEGPLLSFRWDSSYFWNVSPHHNADFTALLSQDGGRTWQDLWSFGSVGEWPDWTWQRGVVDLSDYAGGSVMIAFRVTGANNADVALDDITVRYKAKQTIFQTAVGKINLNLSNHPDGRDSLSVVNASIPEYAFDPSTTETATVNLGGFRQECGDFQRHGGNYVSQFVADSGAKIRLSVNPSKRVWSFKASKATAFGSVLFPGSSLQAFIQIDGQAYGDSVAVDQKTSWSLAAPKTPWNGMYVANATGKEQSVPVGATAQQGSFNISKAYADYTGLIDVDSDTVSLKIGDWQVLDQAALTKPYANSLVYVYKTASGAASPLRFWMDLDRDAWTFSASKADCSLIYGPRISFELKIGTATWRQTVPTYQKTVLSYPRKTLPVTTTASGRPAP